CLTFKEGCKDVSGDFEGGLPAFEGFAKGVVLDFNTQRAAVIDFVQHAHKFRPIDIAKSRDTRSMPFFRKGEDAYLVQFLEMDGHVLRVQMKELVLEFT